MMSHKCATFSLLVGFWIYPLTANSFSRSQDPDTGVFLWWYKRNIEYYINKDCCKDVTEESCLSAVKESFEAWNDFPCSDLILMFIDTTEQRDIGFDRQNWEQNINLVIFRETSWPYESKSIALTTTTYDEMTGEIVDADIEMNGHQFTFSTDDSPRTLMDIQNTLTHEVGHMIGLDHSTNRNATMYATADSGEIKKRTLAEDDINGLCFVYPRGQPTPPSTPYTNNTGCGCGASSTGCQIWLFMTLLTLCCRYFVFNKFDKRINPKK